MNLETLTQKKSVTLGLLQFVVGFGYIAIVATFLQLLERADFEPPEFIAAIMMMTLLVFSATITGVAFLGMPLHLALKGNWTKALQILGFTLLFALMAITLLAIIAFAMAM